MEEEVDNIGRLLTFGNEMPTADVWGQKVDTLGSFIVSRPLPQNLIMSLSKKRCDDSS